MEMLAVEKRAGTEWKLQGAEEMKSDFRPKEKWAHLQAEETEAMRKDRELMMQVGKQGLGWEKECRENEGLPPILLYAS